MYFAGNGLAWGIEHVESRLWEWRCELWAEGGEMRGVVGELAGLGCLLMVGGGSEEWRSE